MAKSERHKMTAFDMEEEKDEGHFDADGNFVWDEESTKQEDAWLEDVSEQQMGLAKQAKSHREFRDEQTEETLTTEAAKRTLVTLLKSNETVLRALKRLGSKKTSRVRNLNKRKQTQRNETTPPMQMAEEKRQFEEITQAADFLMRSGDVEVYDRTKEEFLLEQENLAQQRQVNVSGKSEEKSDENFPKTEAMWEYKATDGNIYGPFPTSCFVNWQQQGFFRGDTAVKIRQVQVASDAAVIGPVNKKQKREVNALSVEQEMLEDFEDSENEDEAQSVVSDSEVMAGNNLWKRSDAIDFSLY